MRRGLLLPAVALCALASVQFAPAASSTPSAPCLVIGDGARFSTLQDAITAAAPDDSLVVRGVCVGVATLDRSVHLVGAGGLGAAVLDGGNQNSVVSVLGGATVTITNLTIEHGSAQPPPCSIGPCPGPETLGGGIKNFGTVTLVHSIVRDSSATFGGGIANFQTFTLINSSVTGNNAGLGGGIWNFGTLTLINSTVSGNRTPLSTGGGGIFTGPFITLINSTVSDNSGGDCIGC